MQGPNTPAYSHTKDPLQMFCAACNPQPVWGCRRTVTRTESPCCVIRKPQFTLQRHAPPHSNTRGGPSSRSPPSSKISKSPESGASAATPLILLYSEGLFGEHSEWFAVRQIWFSSTASGILLCSISFSLDSRVYACAPSFIRPQVHPLFQEPLFSNSHWFCCARWQLSAHLLAAKGSWW